MNPDSCGTRIPPFRVTLETHGLNLVRGETRICQANLGLLCNQVCQHCHLSAGPDRRELMGKETMDQILAFLLRSGIATLDITGGAPELNPHLPYLIQKAGDHGIRLMLRSNLSALSQGKLEGLSPLLTRYRVNVVASLPALNPGQTEAQRGQGMFDISIGTLKRLNALGYGDEKSGLFLDLVSNPTGAFMPSSQGATEARFRRVLADRWGVSFNHLFTFANMPLGRFKSWLERSGNYEGYLTRLYRGFNPCTVQGLMCRHLVSVSWNGFAFDCDFNQAAGIDLGARPIHISELDGPGLAGQEIWVGEHCYACTAGAGFT